ncbi:hypothetical protein [Methylobrevis pamukkalensis]|uniref:Uncharacterized protein n=1 Tax=Methylobrevis pamukkalensis TaxID=1439726 RepID=A0A1E3H3Z4_9HYPH|nr:hypothetical protein [Methylobrevis pamukkalensis]ODN71039.1 hypothetical protein A6302_01600 [Methylobrevis pamukkalensis]
MDWIASNSDAVSALTSAGTLVVWLVYLQVFISSYRSSLRATLVITRGAGEGLAARCLLANMSSGAVYVSSVQIRLALEGGDVAGAVTNIDTEGTTRQGPLEAGASRDLGSFGDLVRQAFAAAARPPSSFRRMTVEAVGIYGSEDLPVGARRTFLIRGDGATTALRSEELWTEQIRGRRDRRKLMADLARDQ